MKIKNIFKTAAAFLAASLCFFYCFVFAQAQQAEYYLTVTLADKQKGVVIQDAEISVYKLGDFTDLESREITFEKSFEEIASTLDFSSSEKTCTSRNANTLVDFVKENEIKPSVSVKSDKNGVGKASLSDMGVYLVEITDSGNYNAEPFIIEIPVWENGTLTYEISASPKISAKTNTNTPGNNTGSTNTGTKIPQTGQLKWPVPVLAIAGVTLVVLGIADRSFVKNRKNKNDKK